MSSRSYRALIKRSTVPSGGTLLHLIREDAEASLCGIPRASLTTSGSFDELMCEECIVWLAKRMDFSAEHPRVGTKDLSGGNETAALSADQDNPGPLAKL